MQKINQSVLKIITDTYHFSCNPEVLPPAWAVELRKSGATDTTVRKCFKLSDTVAYFRAINDKYLGSFNPRCPQISYSLYKLSYPTFTLLVVMPVFPIICIHVLSKEELSLTSEKQIRLCWQSLLEYDDKELRKLFGSNYTEIRDGVFTSYTWHHAADRGKMVLVPRNLHDLCRHSGGNCIWGYGT